MSKEKEWDDAEVDRINALAAMAKKKGYTVKVTGEPKPTENSCSCVDEYVRSQQSKGA